ncbi:hypothetical protein CDL15_Pgr022331 [Punica granatum]|uniref:Uncharacterized protein n=1 Tax=Punica granatum TaxID=22663 RepID=A0A218Y4X8_PUNGR|nr:hypothetical protein CDL15_Pgr022331 [Punica granatum]
MPHSDSCLRLNPVTPPLDDLTCIWASLHAINHDCVTPFLKDIPLPATCQIDWNFVEVMTFWDLVHVVLDVQGVEPTSTIEEYQTLIH